MEGPDSDPGINKRALEALFELAAERKGDFDFAISVSMVEIYNEQVCACLSLSVHYWCI